MLYTRKEFIATGAAFAGVAGSALAVCEAAALRVGIVSDIHITYVSTAGAFEKTLRLFDREKVDAVMIVGDFINWGMQREMEVISKTWYKVFPGDMRSDGVKVVKLFITGNHDVGGFYSPHASPKVNSREDVEKLCFVAHRKEYWRELFGEEYEPISIKTIKGYQFILRNWFLEGVKGEWTGRAKILMPPYLTPEKNPTPDFMAKIAGDLPADRPFFYVQHEYMYGTVMHKLRTMDQKLDTTAKVLSAFPNCLALTGHCHYTLTDERSIWQGGFTAVNCSSGGGTFTPQGHENGRCIQDFNRDPPFEMGMTSCNEIRQAMLMDVFSYSFAFKKIDIVNDMPLGPDWIVPLFGGRTVPPSGTPKYDFAARAASSVAPQFAEGAKVEVTEKKNGHRRMANGRDMDPAPRHQIIVSFPPVVSTATSERAYDFSVTAETRPQDRMWTSIVQEKRVYSPNFSRSEAMDVNPVECAFAYEHMPKKQDIRFVVRPMNCWGKSGEPIYSEWMRFAKVPPPVA